MSATKGAVAAILADGSVVAWGEPEAGGDSSRVQDQRKDVQQLQANCFAFAAILADGSAVTWGNPTTGGDSSPLQDQLRSVQQIHSTCFAFAAILASAMASFCHFFNFFSQVGWFPSDEPSVCCTTHVHESHLPPHTSELGS